MEVPYFSVIIYIVQLYKKTVQSCGHLGLLACSSPQYWVISISHRVNMLYGHIETTFLDIYAKTQLFASSTSHNCHLYARNKYAHQMWHIYHICQISYLHIWAMYVHICAIYEACAFNQTFQPITRKLVAFLLSWCIIIRWIVCMHCIYMQICVHVCRQQCMGIWVFM